MFQVPQRIRDKEHDELKSLKESLHLLDVEKRNTIATKASKRALFLEWIVDRMEKEAVKKIKTFWLEPNIYFSVKNDPCC